MPQLTVNDSRYTLFSMHRNHVLEAARDFLGELDETHEDLKSFVKTVRLYMRDYATHPQVNIYFLKLLDGNQQLILPKNALMRLKNALEEDQALMSQRNCSYVSKRNKILDVAAFATFLLGLYFPEEDHHRKIKIFLIGAVLAIVMQQFKIKDSVNNWDYLGMDETRNIEEGMEPFQAMQIR